MENSVHALLIAFAVIIFVIALTLSFNTLNKAKATADIVLYSSDRETFQEKLSPDLEEAQDGGRDVTMDTVIATLVRTIKENFSVIIKEGSNEIVFDYAIQNKDVLINEINNFIQEHLDKAWIYRETYVEVNTSGQVFEEDGIKIEENVGKRIYITFIKK